MQEPLSPTEARRLIRQILESGEVAFGRHAREEMDADGITEAECFSVLRSGVVEPAEERQGTWRYRVRIPTAYVVCAFRSETSLVIVTVWRLKK